MLVVLSSSVVVFWLHCILVVLSSECFSILVTLYAYQLSSMSFNNTSLQKKFFLALCSLVYRVKVVVPPLRVTGIGRHLGIV